MFRVDVIVDDVVIFVAAVVDVAIFVDAVVIIAAAAYIRTSVAIHYQSFIINLVAVVIVDDINVAMVATYYRA